MKSVAERIRDWEAVRAGFTPGGRGPSLSEQPTTFPPPASSIAPDPRGRRAPVDAQSYFNGLVSGTAYQVLQKGAAVLPVGTEVFGAIGVAQVPTAGSVSVTVTLLGRNSGTIYARCSAGSVPAHFFMQNAEPLDIWGQNGTADDIIVNASWQAWTP